MAPLIYLDTHVAAWMYAGKVDLIPPGAQSLLEEHDLLISPAVLLELEYLYEIRRTAAPGQVVVDALQRDIGLKICDLPFPQVVQVALTQSWTRDPFDRLIVSQAMLRGLPLLTRDGSIRENFPEAIWLSKR
ncbi:MAG TPA: PIN domain-containing protein [Thermoanaerobaculia bacterium]|nr:PIN domain-containing protein [Thermoanaerobaculia bacterium]